MCITTHGSENVKFTVVVNCLEVGSLVVSMNFTVSEIYGVSDILDTRVELFFDS